VQKRGKKEKKKGEGGRNLKHLNYEETPWRVGRSKQTPEKPLATVIANIS